MAAKLRKGDKIYVISGKDRRKTGEIVKVIPDPVHGDKLLIRGINTKMKNLKANPMTGQVSARMQREQPIRASNVALIDPHIGRHTRVGFRSVERLDEVSGEMADLKIRFSKRTGVEVD